MSLDTAKRTPPHLVQAFERQAALFHRLRRDSCPRVGSAELLRAVRPRQCL